MGTRETVLSTLIPDASPASLSPTLELESNGSGHALRPGAFFLRPGWYKQAGAGGAGQGLLSWLFTCFYSRALLLQLSSGVGQRSGYTVERSRMKGCSAQKPVVLSLEAFPKALNLTPVWSQPLGHPWTQSGLHRLRLKA